MKHQINQLPRQAYFLLIPLSFFLITACPDPPDTSKPQKADCPNGFLPCAEDSTICCEVECPPGFLLGGADSTECIAVECPEYYYLCGEDSTDCCLETTSHAMTWEIDTIFTGFVNWAYDVAIINDTAIWVVGRFILDDHEDTLTTFEENFNLIKWDGEKWELKKIYNPEWSQTIGKISSIFALNENDIWVGGPAHYDGINWQFYREEDGWPLFGSSINTIWGSGPDDIFFGSSDGQINHWDGSGFERMDTPTEVHITDIHGTGPNDVWAVGYDLSIAKSTVIHYDETEWSLLYETGITTGWISVDSSLSGNIKQVQTYSSNKNEAWVLANNFGIYHTTVDEAPNANLIKIEYNGKPFSKLRGKHPNDLFIAAHHSGMYHWNGVDIYEYLFPGDIYINAMDMNKNQVIVIGFEGNYLITFRGIKAE